MAGIYIHIPFCKQACSYCNFHFSTSPGLRNQLIDALCSEVELTPVFSSDEKIETIYFGGGTPSILNTDQLFQILNSITKKFSIDPKAEITLEANPDDIQAGSLESWHKLGFNRLSVGLQSFDEKELVWMNRAHHADQSIEALEQIKLSAFENYSIDLIYGSPLQTDAQLLHNLNIIDSYKVPHISCYGLTIEPGTRLHHLVEKKKQVATDDNKQSSQFLLIMQWMRAHGYDHYEVSNYALPGMKSRHNSSYWSAKSYYGFGPSAHSFDGRRTRKWNIANNALYIKSLERQIIPSEEEILTAEQQLNEYVMTSLRTSSGTDLEKINNEWGDEHRRRIETGLSKFTQQGYLIRENSSYRLTDKGMLIADGIASDLFVV